MSYQQVIIKKVSSASTPESKITESFKVVNPVLTSIETPSVKINGLTLDIESKIVTFDYFASVDYLDTNGITRYAFVNGTVTTDEIEDLCIAAEPVPTITTTVTAVANGDATEQTIDFTIGYTVNYKKCPESLQNVDIQ